MNQSGPFRQGLHFDFDGVFDSLAGYLIRFKLSEAVDHSPETIDQHGQNGSNPREQKHGGHGKLYNMGHAGDCLYIFDCHDTDPNQIATRNP